jgi:DNA-binding response OmpR family regulator
MAAILVTEDEHLTRTSVARALQLEAYDVEQAGDGETAIYCLRCKKFDAVVSDFSLPGTLTGLDVLMYYHQLYHQLCPHNLMVLMTASNVDPQKLHMIGAIYLPKPFSLNELLWVINRRLRLDRIA